ncbi:RecT [Burkholderia phage DC1]|uniref:RecT n=1 Tax=Burkholderia phage DC1 TaxID=2881398 RepID=I6NRL5_9CAUD|nr:RecT-like ssDNA annealing protein [Burkholderia phage DC1]AEZ50827.1 RecT [Burkholderia phage DC1]
MSNEQQQQQVTPYHEFREKLNRGIRVEIEKALPPDIDVDRFIRTVLTSVQMNPDLLYANRQSLMNACMRAAQDGLFPDGREAVLNVYNTKVEVQEGNRKVERWIPMVQYLPMVRGIIKVMRNSGEVVSIDAAAVYEKDHFKFVRGDDPRIEHEPYDGPDDPGQVKAAYMIVKLASGEVQREVMYRRDIEKVKSKSKQPNGLMWGTFYDQAAIKSVIKRGSKLLPTSSERLERVIQHDNEAMGFDFGPRVDDAPAIVAPAEPAAPATPAVTDQRAEQDQRRPSRMAGIVSKARAAEPVAAPQAPAASARAAAAGLPADRAPADDRGLLREDSQLPLQAAE